MSLEKIIDDPHLTWFRERARVAYVLSCQKPSQPILGPQSRLGGYPLLPDGAEWPVCTACGTSLFFVGQFGRDLEVLPLPKGADLLTVFKCANMECPLWSDPIRGAPFFELVDTSAIAGFQLPDPNWTGEGIYPPPAIAFGKFGPDSIFIAAEVGYPFAIQIAKAETDYPDWEEHPSWRTIPDSIWHPYLEIWPLSGCKLLGHPAWVQGPDYPRCQCTKTMAQLIQLDYPEVILGDVGRMHIFYCDQWCGGTNSLAALWQCG